jgi:hypothetical protein
VTCRVLKIARQPYYRGLACPVSDAELDEAYVANAVFDAHRDDPEFGYRFLADEVRQAGHQVCDRTVWRICRDNGWWSVFGRPRSRRKTKAGTPAHDDLGRQFDPAGPDRLWVMDVTEHPTDEGKLYLCAILAEPLVGGQLGHFRPAGTPLGVPLRDRRLVLEPPGSRRRVPA